MWYLNADGIEDIKNWWKKLETENSVDHLFEQVGLLEIHVIGGLSDGGATYLKEDAHLKK